jgi:hypothetical protein
MMSCILFSPSLSRSPSISLYLSHSLSFYFFFLLLEGDGRGNTRPPWFRDDTSSSATGPLSSPEDLIAASSDSFFVSAPSSEGVLISKPAEYPKATTPSYPAAAGEGNKGQENKSSGIIVGGRRYNRRNDLAVSHMIFLGIDEKQ